MLFYSEKFIEKKCINKIIFLFSIESESFVRFNRRLIEIQHICDHFQNLKTRFVFEKVLIKSKNFHQQKKCIFNFTKLLKNLALIVLLVTEIQNVRENVCSILYNINLFEKYEKYKKKFISNTVLFLDFSSGY